MGSRGRLAAGATSQFQSKIRSASGLPVTFATSSDNYLVQVQNNGVNATSIDMPNYDGSGYKTNHNPRNGKPYFNTAAFTPNALGTQGNSKRRMFYGSGIENYDMALHKETKFKEKRSLELRLEMFNVFIHALFYPNGSVDGNIGDATFGQVLRTADPRWAVCRDVPLLNILREARRASSLSLMVAGKGAEVIAGIRP